MSGKGSGEAVAGRRWHPRGAEAGGRERASGGQGPNSRPWHRCELWPEAMMMMMAAAAACQRSEGEGGGRPD